MDNLVKAFDALFSAYSDGVNCLDDRCMTDHQKEKKEAILQIRSALAELDTE